MNNLDLLKELGFETAHKNASEKLERFRKMNLAYQNFEFIPAETIDSFNAKLKEKTGCYFDRVTKIKITREEAMKGYTGNIYTYDELVLCSIKEYGQIPPPEALSELKKAQELGCFDSYKVAKIESVVEVVDPIIFGKINGCTDLFKVCQWDKDIDFNDLKKEVNDVFGA